MTFDLCSEFYGKYFFWMVSFCFSGINQEFRVQCSLFNVDWRGVQSIYLRHSYGETENSRLFYSFLLTFDIGFAVLDVHILRDPISQ